MSVPPIATAQAVDETGERRDIQIAGEYPLTLYVDKHEVVTLMTLGRMPEELAIGWLRNQRIVREREDITEVQVDWEVNAVAVRTRDGFSPDDIAGERRTVTSGCGQGSMFSRLMEEVEEVSFVRRPLFSAPVLHDLLAKVRAQETVYKRAGAVHGCALAAQDGERAELLLFVEDIGRHNAVDAIAGWMWMNDINGDGKVFYTTGRLTSEMVIKCAQMRVPYLVSRSGVTRMGYDIANATGLTMLGRALNRRYLIFSGAEHFMQPPEAAQPPAERGGG